MPVHAAPVVAAALGYIGAQGCNRNPTTPRANEDDNTANPDNATSGAWGAFSPRNDSGRSSPKGNSVRFSSDRSRLPDQSVGGDGVRAMYSERMIQNQHRHMEVRLRSASSNQNEDDTPFDSISGFVGGDFSAGKVKDIRLPSGCWAMAFSVRADLLATGLKDQVDFLETVNFTPVYSLPRTAKVSDIQWCPGSALSLSASLHEVNEKAAIQAEDEELVAVAGLDGHVGVYIMDVALLELKGVQTVHEFRVQGEIRCMAFKPLGNGKVVVAVGDKQGKITLITMFRDEVTGAVNATYPAVVDLGKDPVLGLDIHVGSSILAASTKGGKVVVFELVQTNFHIATSYAICNAQLWTTQRNGAVRVVTISRDGKQLAFGGYDKTLVLVDTRLFAVVREICLQGTINTIAMDPLDRFLVVGCRDKSITVYDTTTFFPIKRLQTPGWVTSISWGVPGIWSDTVAVRSENTGISILDLTPIHMTDVELSSMEGFGSTASWTPDGSYLARVVGDMIHIVDSRYAFCPCAEHGFPSTSLRSIAFSPVPSKEEESGVEEVALAAVGLDGTLSVLKFIAPDRLELVHSTFVEENLWAVSWSFDGKFISTGGKGKTLSLFSFQGRLELQQTTTLDGRIWDVRFNPRPVEPDDGNGVGPEECAIAVACGDYKAIFFEQSNLQPTLHVHRSRTVRCLDFHPTLPLLAVGDGAGTIAVVDYRAEETIKELDVGGRVNVVRFSPTGDYLLVGTDDCTFTLRETTTYSVVQELPRRGFALSAEFSSTGKYLALGGSVEPYSVVRLGPLLGIDLVPLEGGPARLPAWALRETLFRSGYGPSLVQRHMMRGSQDNLQWVSSSLKEYPDAIYTYNRHRKENCLETALRLRKVKLLQVAITTLVNGSLENRREGKRSFLTTSMPETGRKTMEEMVARHPAEIVVQILKQMGFFKVPFTQSHIVARDKRMVCGSHSYLDPWKRQPLADADERDEGKLTRTAAVLPIPGLGSLDFLSALVDRAPAIAFDNEAMAIVLRVMWRDHIRQYFIIDTIFFAIYFAVWILLIEPNSSSIVGWADPSTTDKAFAFSVLVLNSLFAFKEAIQSDLGRRPTYFSSLWNQADIASILLVYSYTMATEFLGVNPDDLVPLAVVTTLLLTLKVISYLRAFNETGWLVTVLSRNFWDVRGFLLVLLSILVGFSASFRLLFANVEPFCETRFDEVQGLSEECDENPFGSLRKSILATFELTILGSYEPSLLHENPHSTLSILVFVLAVTCVLVVALNALISLLADSYARVQEDATANQRKEKAELIVEYMSLIPRWRRRRIEKNTKYFHALLEADADGDLVLDDDDWHGGLNALRDDIEESNKAHAEAQLRAMENLRSEFEREMSAFRGEVQSMLQDLSEDLKTIRKTQAEGGVTLSGKRVAGAVKAVKEIRRKGTELLTLSGKPGGKQAR